MPYTNIIYNTLNYSDLVRVDFIANDKEVVFLEVNTIPGMSDKSIVPKQIQHYGMNMKDVINILLEEAFSK